MRSGGRERRLQQRERGLQMAILGKWKVRKGRRGRRRKRRWARLVQRSLFFRDRNERTNRPVIAKKRRRPPARHCSKRKREGREEWGEFVSPRLQRESRRDSRIREETGGRAKFKLAVSFLFSSHMPDILPSIVV